MARAQALIASGFSASLLRYLVQSSLSEPLAGSTSATDRTSAIAIDPGTNLKLTMPAPCKTLRIDQVFCHSPPPLREAVPDYNLIDSTSKGPRLGIELTAIDCWLTKELLRLI